MRVAVVGLGKLGAPLAAVLASKGNEVLGVDVNEKAVELVNSGRAPVEEPGLQELITVSRDRLRATTEISATADADASILLVPTPSNERGAFSNDYLLAAIEELGRGLSDRSRYHVVIVGSTVMPGSCDGEIRAALERASGRIVGETLGLCYSPEFIALGNVIRDMLEPDMVLVGASDARAGDVAESLYKRMVDNDPPFRRMSLVNAELTKIAVNTYVTMKISYANSLADICERLPGADVAVVTDALGLDTRIGKKYLRGAIAYGGPCFPRDNKAFATLTRDLGSEPLLAEATDAVNVAQTDRLARIVQSQLPDGGAVGILGLSYKPDTSVIEESAGVALGRILVQAGYNLHLYDPVATDAALAALGDAAHGAASARDVLDQSDVVVITTPWPEFADLPLADGNEGPLVIDCWGIVPVERVQQPTTVIRLGRALAQSSPV
jgi:UDPglucose 6-dehydrogenase